MLKTDKKTYFYMESIVDPYETVLEGPGNYFSFSINDYTDVLHFIAAMGLLICKKKFLFLLLYVEPSHFVPYTTLVVNKRLYET